VSAAALGVDSNTLLPALIFQETESLDGKSVPIAWQAGYPLTSFDPQGRQWIYLAETWLKERSKADSFLTLSGRGDECLNALETEAERGFRVAYDDSKWKEIQLPNPENMMKEYRPEDYQGWV